MSIASRITAIEEHIRDVYDTIDYSYDTTDVDKNIINIPQNIFNGYLDVLNNGTDTLWNNLEKVSASGEEATLENVETAPMKMVLNGNTSQDGEPTPDTPVDVQVVTGENVVSVQGKNLFDKDNQAKIQVNAEGTLRYGIIVNAPNKKVSISGKNWSGYIAYKPLTNGIYGQWVNTNRDTTINVTDKLIIYSNGDTIKLDTYVDDLQIEISDTPTFYAPYTKTDYPINLGTIELCKIGDYKDYLFKRNGKWYVHKEVGKVVFDGSESWTLSSLGAGKFYLEISPIFKMISETAIGIKPYSSHFVGKDNSLGFENRKVVLMTSSYGGTTHYFARFENDNTPTLSEWKTWLSNNNVTLYYVLATPTEEEITNTTLIEQLEAIFKAKSIKDKTYITQTNDELPFILDVEAIKEYEVN